MDREAFQEHWRSKVNMPPSEEVARITLAKREEIKSRSQACKERSRSIIESVGGKDFGAGPYRREFSRSRPISLGKLDVTDDQGRDHGFATVTAEYKVHREVTRAPRRFWFDQIVIVQTPGDEIVGTTIHFYAGSGDASNLSLVYEQRLEGVLALSEKHVADFESSLDFIEQALAVRSI